MDGAFATDAPSVKWTGLYTYVYACACACMYMYIYMHMYSPLDLNKSVSRGLQFNIDSSICSAPVMVSLSHGTAHGPPKEILID